MAAGELEAPALSRDQLLLPASQLWPWEGAGHLCWNLVFFQKKKMCFYVEFLYLYMLSGDVGNQ